MLSKEQKQKSAAPADDKHQEHEFSRNRMRTIFSYDKEIFKEKIVADFGCGHADGTIILLSEGHAKKVYAIDINDNALEIAQKRNNHPGIQYIKNELWETGLDKKTIDIISMVEVIEHLDGEERAKTLKHMNEILKDGGYVFVTTPERNRAKYHYPDGSHWTEFQQQELTDIFEEYGFRKIISKATEQTTAMYLFIKEKEMTSVI